jgi:hypothetical protein
MAGFVAFVLFAVGDWGPLCLGGIGYTQVQCIAGYVAEHPGWSPGPGSATPWVAAIAGALMVAGVSPWSITRRQFTVMAATAAVGAVLGAVVYELLRQPRLVDQGATGIPPNVQYWVVNVALPSNPDARLLVMVLAATAVALAYGFALALRARPWNST